MKCSNCASLNFRNGLALTHICNECELVHYFNGKPLGWTVTIGMCSGGISPFTSLLSVVLGGKSDTVACAIVNAAYVGLMSPAEIKLLSLEQERVADGDTLPH